ncbi:hypothetical protein GIB67_043086 [Kingdonia uniflora]|uniref:Uncharacterized protein n=1 Tax=Kingdonia uniflora TaxID=39325 RepID=A0A7J7ND67_9MAGN|nr:hypothetical protein GIB67_043086 [Kingdonia uniflora]
MLRHIHSRRALFCPSENDAFARSEGRRRNKGIRKLDDTEFRNVFTKSYIRVRAYEGSASRSRSPTLAEVGVVVEAEAEVREERRESPWNDQCLDHHRQLNLKPLRDLDLDQSRPNSVRHT